MNVEMDNNLLRSYVKHAVHALDSSKKPFRSLILGNGRSLPPNKVFFYLVKYP